MKRTRIRSLINNQEALGQELLVKGWVRTVRAQKSCVFLEINDGSTLSNLQVITDRAPPEATTGASVVVKGRLVASPGSGQQRELHAIDIVVVGGADPQTYPLQKKRHSLEFLRTIAHLRPRTNTLGAVARVRNTVAYATHRFFHDLGFLYVQTPIITLSDCEGAGKLFQVTTLDREKPPRTETQQIDYSKDFFGQPAYLTVSGQLNGESYASALSDIYTFGPTFRAENSHTSRHLAEFWMIEPEMAFADLHEDMELAEAYLRAIFDAVLSENEEDLSFFEKFFSEGLLRRLETLRTSSFVRMTYTEAVELLQRSGKNFVFPVSWGCDLQSEHERYLCEEYCQQPVIVYDYPAAIKSFYMRSNADGKTVAAMDVLVPGVGEIIGGSQREERAAELEAKMRALQLDIEKYWWYRELRQYGSVPHAGFGVGFERLVQFITGMENIRDIIAFPRYPGYAEF